MGNCGEESSEMFHMATQSDDMPMLIRALVKMLNAPTLRGSDMVVEGDKVYVTMYGMLRVVRETLEEKMSERALEACINSLAVSMEPFVRDGKHYREMDMSIVEDYSTRWGISIIRDKE